MTNLLPDTALAEALSRRLHDATVDPAGGVTRAAYDWGERVAHAMVREAAECIGLETRTDPAGNLYMTLPGVDRTLPQLLFGSHLDSVPQGGDHDGVAGVLAGSPLLPACAAQATCPIGTSRSWLSGRRKPVPGSPSAVLAPERPRAHCRPKPWRCNGWTPPSPWLTPCGQRASTRTGAGAVRQPSRQGIHLHLSSFTLSRGRFWKPRTSRLALSPAFLAVGAIASAEYWAHGTIPALRLVAIAATPPQRWQNSLTGWSNTGSPLKEPAGS